MCTNCLQLSMDLPAYSHQSSTAANYLMKVFFSSNFAVS